MHIYNLYHADHCVTIHVHDGDHVSLYMYIHHGDDRVTIHVRNVDHCVTICTCTPCQLVVMAWCTCTYSDTGITMVYVHSDIIVVGNYYMSPCI